MHYKTIIFPIIGYPIFRDTIIYSKINRYKEGELARDVSALRTLTETYYTVENIGKKETVSEEGLEFLKEKKEFEIQELKKLESFIDN